VLGSSLVDAQLAASQEGLSSMKLVLYLFGKKSHITCRTAILDVENVKVWSPVALNF
jgi:hypothetical protein